MIKTVPLGTILALCVEQFWSYIENIVIPNIYPENAYTGDRLNFQDRKYTSDLMAFRVGPVRLRQQRRRPISCNRKGPFQKEEKAPCDQTFSEGNYNAGSWYKPMKNNSINLGKDIWELAYIYRTAIDLRGVSYSGIYETYTGAGYAAELGVNLS